MVEKRKDDVKTLEMTHVQEYFICVFSVQVNSNIIRATGFIFF